MFAARIATHIKASSSVTHVTKSSQKHEQSNLQKDLLSSSSKRNTLNFNRTLLQHQSSFSELCLTTISKEKKQNIVDIFSRYRNNKNDSSNEKEQLERELFELMKSLNEDSSHVSLLIFFLIVALGWWTLDDANADSDPNVPVTRLNDTEKSQLEAVIKEGIQFMNARKFKLAKEAFQAAILMDPKNVVAHTFKAACHIEMGEYEDAINECDLAQMNDAKGVLTPRIQFFKGIALALTGEHLNAIECFTMATLKQPHEFPTAFAWTAKSFAALGKFPAALGAVKKGLRYTQDHKMIRLHGMLLSKVEMHKQAIEVLNDALKEQPKDILAWITKGVSLFALGEDTQAQQCFDEAIKLYPKCAMVLLNKVFAADEVELELPTEFLHKELGELCA